MRFSAELYLAAVPIDKEPSPARFTLGDTLPLGPLLLPAMHGRTRPFLNFRREQLSCVVHYVTIPSMIAPFISTQTAAELLDIPTRKVRELVYQLWRDQCFQVRWGYKPAWIIPTYLVEKYAIAQSSKPTHDLQQLARQSVSKRKKKNQVVETPAKRTCQSDKARGRIQDAVSTVSPSTVVPSFPIPSEGSGSHPA